MGKNERPKAKVTQNKQHKARGWIRPRKMGYHYIGIRPLWGSVSGCGNTIVKLLSWLPGGILSKSGSGNIGNFPTRSFLGPLEGRRLVLLFHFNFNSQILSRLINQFIMVDDDDSALLMRLSHPTPLESVLEGQKNFHAAVARLVFEEVFVVGWWWCAPKHKDR